jgi:hypothetical protein
MHKYAPFLGLIDFLDCEMLGNCEERATSGPKIRIDNIVFLMIMISEMLGECLFCQKSSLHAAASRCHDHQSLV